MDELFRILDKIPPSTESRPFITLTYAQSLDGCIAYSQPSATPLILSSPESMVMTHHLRATHDAILVGISTVLNDNPSLTTRLCEGPSPRPIILDTELRTPLHCKLMTNVKKPIIVCGKDANREKWAELESSGAVVIESPNLSTLFACLKKEHGIQRIMVEGGARVIHSLLMERDLVDCLILTIAPVFVGVGGLQPSHAKRKENVHEEKKACSVLPSVSILHQTQLGTDIVVLGLLQ